MIEAEIDGDVSEFENEKTKKALLRKPNKIFRTRNIENMKVCDFISAERALSNKEFEEFVKLFVLKFPWQKVYVHNLEPICSKFKEQIANFVEIYTYIFGQNNIVSTEITSTGYEKRKDFVSEFGNYVVLMDLVCGGNISNYKKVEQWKVHEFMFWANYLTGQKIIENIK